MGTPKTDPDYEHSEAALRDEEVDAVIACLGDDAAKLREENPECEIAANMEAAAAMLEALRAEVHDLGMALHHSDSATRVAVATAREKDLIALREWAVNCWRCEVQHRPMVNIHRRTLDDCWRQVMRYAGLDPDEAVGLSHDELLAAGSAEMARRDALGPWEDGA